MSHITALTALSIICGCAVNGDRIALENQLRRQETALRELKQQVTETEKLLRDQDQELVALRVTAASRRSGSAAGGISTVSASAETRTAWGSVTSLRLHKLTSGLIRDEQGVPQALSLVLQPLDEDRELVKVFGSLTITVSVIKPNGVAQELLSRSLTMTECRRLWTRGLVSTGFHVELPLPEADDEVWQQDDNKLLVSAALELAPDRTYAMSELLDVTPVTGQ